LIHFYKRFFLENSITYLTESHIQRRNMVSDIQLAMFANLIGILLFLLVVLYHFIHVNY